MLKLNRKTEYALMALRLLSLKKQGTKLTAKDVAEEVNGPFDVVSRVLQQMTQKGMLQSEQGKQGGYWLQQPLHAITFFDVLTAINGPLHIAKCLDSKSACEQFEHCHIRNPIDSLNAKLKTFYQSLTVAEVLVGSPDLSSAEPLKETMQTFEGTNL